MKSEARNSPSSDNDQSHVSRLGVGGALLLFGLRQWVWCFSAGHPPPACVSMAFHRAGCPDVPRAMLRLLRLLRGSMVRPILFHAPARQDLTDAELNIMRAISAARAGDANGLRAYTATLIDSEFVGEASYALDAIAESFRDSSLQVWSDTTVRRSAPVDGQICQFQQAASGGKDHLAETYRC